MKDINEIVKKWEHFLNAPLSDRPATVILMEAQERWIQPTEVNSLSTQPAYESK